MMDSISLERSDPKSENIRKKSFYSCLNGFLQIADYPGTV